MHEQHEVIYVTIFGEIDRLASTKFLLYLGYLLC